MTEPAEYRQPTFTPPPGSVELLVVRHGESAAAREDAPFALRDGHGDPELHPAGRVQAERVADRLEHEPLDAIYVSTLRRTHETAAPLAARRGLDPIELPDLREVYLGEWEGGIFRKFVREGHPIAVELANQERWDVIPGAEPAEVFRSRVQRAVSTIAERHPGQRVAVFTHGAWIGELFAIAASARSFAFAGADNASISQLVVAGDRWILRRFNDTSHLTEGFSVVAQPPT